MGGGDRFVSGVYEDRDWSKTLTFGLKKLIPKLPSQHPRGLIFHGTIETRTSTSVANY